MDHVILINANRSGYSIDQIRDTMTVSDLISYLEQFESEDKVYLKHDGGYTYGGITYRDFEEKYVDSDGEEHDEDEEESEDTYDESLHIDLKKKIQEAFSSRLYHDKESKR